MGLMGAGTATSMDLMHPTVIMEAPAAPACRGDKTEVQARVTTVELGLASSAIVATTTHYPLLTAAPEGIMPAKPAGGIREEMDSVDSVAGPAGTADLRQAPAGDIAEVAQASGHSRAKAEAAAYITMAPVRFSTVT